MKKTIIRIKSILAAALCGLTAAAAAGCGSVNGSAATINENGDKKLSIVCTGFSEYDWTKNILGEKAADAELTYLLEGGADMHSYQPTAADIAKIATCDVFIYVGGESQEWADDALANSSCRSVKLLDVLAKNGAVKEEEIKEGMQAEEEEHEEEGAPEYDEHVWLTPGNAEIFVRAICDELAAADPSGKDVYTRAADDYIVQLDELKADFASELSACPNRTLIVGDRFPFRYLADEYGLDYYAAFAGCSAETEASFETVAFLSKKLDETGVKTVFTLENSDGKIANAVIANSSEKSADTAALDSLQSVNSEQIKEGASYISIMRKNLEALTAALK
ncbi:MAG: metal ABC transporter substrate-binding protein [Ruminococcus sp.]|nr:metal ABC transporter substrate-binding protein [Ruminococcus sp.]